LSVREPKHKRVLALEFEKINDENLGTHVRQDALELGAGNGLEAA
jgi:hypothetical protein